MIDAHVHFWDRNALHYDWLADEPNLPAQFLPGDLAGQIDPEHGFVVVQADCRPQEGLDEARWVDRLAAEFPAIRGFVAFAGLESPDALSELEKLAELSLVKGVRRLLQSEPVEFFDDSALGEGLRAVESFGWTFDACIRWWQIEALESLARRHEGLTIIVDHLAKPPISDEGAFNSWRAGLERLAALPNTVLKLSGLPAETGAKGVDLAAWVRAGYDLFGPKRSMVGSDWPVSSANGMTYRGWFELIERALGVSEIEHELVFGGTAQRVYQFSN